MKGSCHCGAVDVTLAAEPAYINLCDCSLCLKLGGAWAYYSSADVDIAGSTRAYRRADYDEPAVEVHFCPTCGATTHWILTEHYEGDRMGVNMRLFEPSKIEGIEARTLDGRNWTGETEAALRRPHGKLGKDVFI